MESHFSTSFKSFFFSSAIMTDLIFRVPSLTVDLYILSEGKKSVCREDVFLKVTSSELFVNVLAGTLVVVKLLAGLRKITPPFQVIYVIVLNLGSLYQLLKLLEKADGRRPWIQRVLSSSLPTQTGRSHGLRTGDFPCCFWPVCAMCLSRKPFGFE